MSFLDNNINEVRLVLTQYGKKEFLSNGVDRTFRFFSFSDDNVLYDLCVEPQGVLDITGSHKSSTTKYEPRFKVNVTE